MNLITVNNETIVTTKELCAILKCSEIQVIKWKAQGMPKFTYNRWILEEVKDWIKNEYPFLKYRKK